jgi:hypothetical protein
MLSCACPPRQWRTSAPGMSDAVKIKQIKNSRQPYRIIRRFTCKIDDYEMFVPPVFGMHLNGFDRNIV